MGWATDKEPTKQKSLHDPSIVCLGGEALLSRETCLAFCWVGTDVSLLWQGWAELGRGTRDCLVGVDFAGAACVVAATNLL